MSMMRAEGMPSLLQLLRGVFTWSFFFGSIITVFSFMAVVSAEMQALGTYQDLVKARGEVVQINPASFDPTNDGKLVYATGI
ncbi:MAG TPA: hypothetical protein PKO06_06960, partial [Candidatus Ozemobacteraceae bacterium]|nr:hypothetical protein [Candidatus Ozemobacteraceae bacterium]